MGFGIIEHWVNGPPRVGTIKFKMDYVPLKSQYSIVPRFHYSVVEAKIQTSKSRCLCISYRTCEMHNRAFVKITYR